MKQEIRRAIVASILLSMALSGSVWSHQEPSSAPDEKSQQTSDAHENNAAPEEKAAGAGSDILQVRQMKGANVLPTGRVSSFQFGPIYLQSVDFYQALETISASNMPQTLFESVSIFRADVVFDHAWRTSRLAVQYEPRLTVTNGLAQTSTANLNATWNKLYTLSPRLSLGLKNGFGYYSQQAQFDGLNLEGDLTTGALVQAHFLDGPGHFLNDRSEVDIRYLLSQRNRLDVSPFFEYYSASGGQNLNVTESKSPGAELGFSRLLSDTRTIGFGYAVQDTSFGKLLPRTLYQTVNMTYAQQVGPTWRYAMTVGATHASTAIGPSQNTTTGNLNLIKLFRDSTLAFRYDRGQAVGLQITNGFADRFDTSYERRLIQRTRAVLAAGYYRQFLAVTNTSGIYASVGLNYQIANHWFLQTFYTFKNQKNGGANFATGDLQYASFGIRWEPGWRPADFH
jgi:hypothetical protein